MKRDEILNMPAGRDMDAQVGYIVYPDAKKHGFIVCPKYSTDIKEAWEVVEKLQVEPYAWQFEIANTTGGKSYEAILWGGDNDPMIQYDARANTMPLAICRAALLAMVAA